MSNQKSSTEVEPNATIVEIGDHPKSQHSARSLTILLSKVVLTDKPKKQAWTKRQKFRLYFIPWMAILVLLALVIEIVFELQCDATTVTKKYEILREAIFWIETPCYVVTLFAILAFLGVLCPRKPNMHCALTFSAMIMLFFFITIFAGWHYYSETMKIGTTNGLLRINNMSRKDEHFFKREYVWLEIIQQKLTCCGLNGYNQYDPNAADSLNANNWLQNESFLLEKEDVPKSCCKPEYAEDNECGHGVFTNSSKINQDCQVLLWVMVFLPLIIGVPMTIMMCFYVRQIQGVPCHKGCCSNLASVPDPELDEIPTPKNNNKKNKPITIRKIILADDPIKSLLLEASPEPVSIPEPEPNLIKPNPSTISKRVSIVPGPIVEKSQKSKIIPDPPKETDNIPATFTDTVPVSDPNDIKTPSKSSVLKPRPTPGPIVEKSQKPKIIPDPPKENDKIPATVNDTVPPNDIKTPSKSSVLKPMPKSKGKSKKQINKPESTTPSESENKPESNN